jgi:putative two-component system response regulator
MTPPLLPKLLIVDDEPLNINVLVELFKQDYRLAVAKNGAQALQRARDEAPPDLILLDIMMPGMSGYQVIEALKADPTTRPIPVVFVTALGEVGDETQGLELGAIDYITKPISPPIVKARVRNHIELKRAREELLDQNAILEQRVAERTREIRQTQDVTIQALASLAETRDSDTGSHIRRTQLYVEVLANAMLGRLNRGEPLDQRTIELMTRSAPLHDIGKVGVPDHILLKPDKLTPEEFAVIKRHPTVARDALAAAEGISSEASSFLRIAREIAYTHHERWDGTGYPEGIEGDNIPLAGRLMALADVYDALISTRVYKPAYTHEKAVEIIAEGRGTHFDPELVDLFLEKADEIRTIALRFAEPQNLKT